MTTKQTTQLCYQVNGGTCRNKVSAKNGYICAAKHSARKLSPVGMADEADKKPQYDLAKNPSIDVATQQTLFDAGIWGIRRELAANPSLDHDIAQALFDMADERIRRELAANPSVTSDIQQALFETKNKPIWGELSRNPSLDHAVARSLYDNERDLCLYLAMNPSIGQDTIQALFDDGGWETHRQLSRNPSIDREMAIRLASYGHLPTGYLKNKTLTQLCQPENLSLVDKYPKEFGQAYLDHLIGLDDAEITIEQQSLLVYSFCAYKETYRNDIETYKSRILNKYPNDEELKILLS